MFFPCPFTLLHCQPICSLHTYILREYLQFVYLRTLGFIRTLKNVKLAPYYNSTNEQKTTTCYCNPILHLYQLPRSFFVLETLKLWR